MRYVLTVKRLETNEDYLRQLEDWNGRNKFRDPMILPPQPEIPTLALEVIVTEEEFKKIKEAVLTVIN